ncbi:MAG: type II toxin-antitoxin system PemK/MazF family toxin [Bryobacteraceae bacterium]
MICDRWEVVAVPFPFTDRPGQRRRPAVVLSSRAFNGQTGHTVCAMITSASHPAWPDDVEIRDPDSAGLRVPCLVRLKLFTLDKRLIVRRLGKLGDGEREQLLESLREHVFGG